MHLNFDLHYRIEINIVFYKKYLFESETDINIC